MSANFTKSLGIELPLPLQIVVDTFVQQVELTISILFLVTLLMVC